mgnify:CR=1 FL=1
MKTELTPMMKKRIFATIIGVIVCAVSVGFFKAAAFGVDPFQSFMSGLDSLIPIQFGTLYVIANCVLLLFSFVFDRHYIGLGTLINLLLTGYIAQYSMQFILYLLPEPGAAIRAVYLLVGIVMMCFSSAFYFTADLGVSTYDAVALILSDKWHIADFKYCRIGCDLCCVILGCILFLVSGGKISGIPAFAGIGTIITAFFMGPLIEFFNEHCARPYLRQ